MSWFARYLFVLIIGLIAGFLNIHNVYADTVPSAFAQFKLNDNAATPTVLDESASLNHAVASVNTSTLSVTGKVNRALSLNGSNQSVNLSDLFNDIRSDSQGSFSLWVKPVNGFPIVEFSGPDGYFAIEWYRANQSATFTIAGKGTPLSCTTSTGTLPANVFSHLVITQDGSQFKIYINGVEQTNLTYWANSDPGAWLSFLKGTIDDHRLGATFVGANQYFLNGSFDDLRYYKHALAADEVAALYNNGTGTEEANPSTVSVPVAPFAQFKLNDNVTNTIVVDASAAGNNGVSNVNTSSLSVTGKINRALSLNGLNQHVNLSSLYNDIKNDPEGSFSLWVKPVDSFPILEFSGPQGYFAIEWYETNKSATFAISSPNASIASSTANNSMPANVFSHLVVTQDGSRFKIYINGVEQTGLIYWSNRTPGVWLSSLGEGINDIRLGATGVGGRQYYFSGVIDDLRYYKQALSSAQILAIYNSGNGTEEPIPPTPPGPNPLPTVMLSANPTSIVSGGTSTLTWSSTNATSCTTPGSSTAISGTYTTPALTATRTYTVTCTGTGGSQSASVTVTVTSTVAPIPTVTLSANPTSIAYNGTSTLTWSSTNATSCTTPGTSTATSGTFRTPSLTTDKTYSVTCNGPGGSKSASVSITVADPVVPVNGSCGSADGGNFASVPSTSLLCSIGTPSAISGTGPWTWTCSGISGGSPASCSANRTPAGVTDYTIGNHPRLYLDAGKITFLKEKIRATEPYKSKWLEVKALADKYISETPPVYPSDPIFDATVVKNKLRWLGNKLPFIALAYLLSGEDKYFNGAKKWMDAFVSYTSWAGDDDLAAGHLLYNMAITYDWLYQDFSPADRARYITKMTYHAEKFAVILGQLPKGWWAVSFTQNHNYVNSSALMTAAVAGFESMPNADRYIKLSYNNFTTVLENIRDDGTSEEGIPYWTYGMEALLRYFDIEKRIYGIDRILTSNHFKNATMYRLYGSLPDYRHIIRFGDTISEDYQGPNFILWRLASTFKNASAPYDQYAQYAQWLAKKIDAKKVSSGGKATVDWRNLLWYDETITEKDVTYLPTYRLFDDLEIFTSRSAWSDDNAVMLALKAGPPGGHSAVAGNKISGHIHPDEGAFTLNAFGKDLVIDDGYPYLKLTSNHNIATFDGIGQEGEGEMWFNKKIAGQQADIVYSEFNPSAGFEYLIADVTGVYGADLRITKYLRHFIFIKKNTLVIIDEIQSEINHRIDSRFHLNYDATFALNNKTLSGRLTGTDIGLVVDDISAETHTYSFNKEAITSDNTAKAKTWTFYTNTLTMTKSGTQARIETVIRPFKGTVPGPIEYSRNPAGELFIKLSDGTYTSISTSLRQIRMNATPPRP